MKIQHIKFKDYRNVPDMDMELRGWNIILFGENTVGKSNFGKGILGTLGGSFGKNAIKTGKDKAEIVLNMADYENDQPIPGTEYTFKAMISKKGEEEVVKLEVTAPNGMRDTKKTVIGSIVGELELDYNFVELSKTLAGKKKQVEIVKQYLDEDTRESLRIEENKVKIAFDERTEIGRLLKSAQGFVKEAGLNPEDFKKYAKPVDTAQIVSQKASADKKNQEGREIIFRMQERRTRLVAIAGQIAKLKEEENELLEKNSKAEKWVSENPEINTSAFEQELTSAGEHNAMHQKVQVFAKKQKEAKEYEDQVGDLTVQIETSRQAISDAIKDMSFPISGITFDEENVFYNGKMIDENNMSTAEIMILEAELKMCKAPGAEVLFVHRGESLGNKLLAELRDRAKARGMQLIMEQVERGTEELKVVLMPDTSKNASGSLPKKKRK
jgi:hypothetical protein